MKSRLRDLNIESTLLRGEQGSNTRARLRAESKAATCVVPEKEREKVKETEKLQVKTNRRVLVKEKKKLQPSAGRRVTVKEKEKVQAGAGRRATWDGQCLVCIYRIVGKPGGPKHDTARVKATRYLF